MNSVQNIIKLEHFYHNKENQIRLTFKYNQEIIDLIKHIEGIKWSNTNKCWYILNNAYNLKKIRYLASRNSILIDKDEFFNKKTHISENDILLESKLEIINKVIEKKKENIIVCPKEFIQELTLRRYSENTIKSYKYMFLQFINYFIDK